jgi:WD40 repeat protein
MPVILSGYLLATGYSGPAQGQADTTKRFDRYGEPLPEGAVARLGSSQTIPPGELTSVAVSPDGTVAATGLSEYGRGHSIHVWGTATGQTIGRLARAGSRVTALCFGPGGHTLFAGYGRRIAARDASTGKEIWEQACIKDDSFHGDPDAELIVPIKDRLLVVFGGKLLCTVRGEHFESRFYHRQNAVRFLDAKTGRLLSVPTALESTVHAEVRVPLLFHDVAVSPDGKYVALLVGQADPKPGFEGSPEDQFNHTHGRLHIVETGSGKVIHAFPATAGVWYGLTFSGDRQKLAFAAGKDIGVVHIAEGRLDLLTAALPSVYPDDLVHRRAGRSWFAFQDGNKRLAVRLPDNSTQVWDVRSRRQVDPADLPWYLFETAKAGNFIASVRSNQLRVLDLRSGHVLPAFEGHRQVPLVRFALQLPDTFLSIDGTLAIQWDTRAWTAREYAMPPEGGFWRGWFYRQLVATRFDDGVSVEKGLYVRLRGDRSELRAVKDDRLVRRLAPRVRGRLVCFSATGNRFVTCDEGVYRFFDVATGKCLAEVPDKPVPGSLHDSPMLSSRGALFAMGTDDGRIHLFEVSSGKFLRTLPPASSAEWGYGGDSRKFQFSGDEKLFISEVHRYTDDERQPAATVGVALWDVSTDKLFREVVTRVQHRPFRGFLEGCTFSALTLSPDHRLIAFSEKDRKTIDIWEVASGTKRGELPGHAGAVADLAFSPDGRLLASSSEDTTILIWDVNRPFRPGKFPKSLTEQEMFVHWQTLLYADAEQADTAIWSLVHAPGDSLQFLRKQIRPVALPDRERVQSSLRALDSTDFKTRSEAEAELERHGERVLKELEATLKQKNSMDKQRCLERLLDKARRAALPFDTRERIGQWRALEVLERIGTPEAKHLVRELADGAPGAVLTEVAKSVLARMESPTKP